MKVSYIREPQSIRITIRWRKPHKWNMRYVGERLRVIKAETTADLKAWVLEQLNDGCFSQVPQKRTDRHPINDRKGG